jgi:FkbM family methyltransferase
MKNKLKNFIKYILKQFDIGIARYSEIENFLENKSSRHDIDILTQLPEETALQRLKYLGKSKSQLKQDLFALSQLNFKRDGFFVEFGATNGLELSNTFLMESEFNWSGILAEPARCWHAELKLNRNCNIDTNCVWKESNTTIKFNEANSADLSTIYKYKDSDSHRDSRKNANVYDVKTISLNELLNKYNAPSEIDYLSIDTEGSEFDILNNFDFSKYKFKVITCEHNYTDMRLKIFDLLTKHGYTRVYENLSLFDDWYISQ